MVNPSEDHIAECLGCGGTFDPIGDDGEEFTHCHDCRLSAAEAAWEAYLEHEHFSGGEVSAHLSERQAAAKRLK